MRPHYRASTSEGGLAVAHLAEPGLDHSRESGADRPAAALPSHAVCRRDRPAVVSRMQQHIPPAPPAGFPWICAMHKPHASLSVPRLRKSAGRDRLHVPSTGRISVTAGNIFRLPAWADMPFAPHPTKINDLAKMARSSLWCPGQDSKRLFCKEIACHGSPALPGHGGTARQVLQADDAWRLAGKFRTGPAPMDAGPARKAGAVAGGP